MACNPEILRQVPLFALLDDEETAVLAGQVEVKKFAARQRIYKMGDPGERAYVLVSGSVRVTTVDEDHQEVIIDQPTPGEFFGFASMLEQTPHQTTAVADEETICLEVDRHDISVLLERKPLAGMDMLTVLGKQFHASQQLVRLRASRNPNEVIEEKETFGERIADVGIMDVHHHVRGDLSFLFLYKYRVAAPRLGPISVHLAQLVSFHAGRYSSANYHDEPEPPG